MSYRLGVLFSVLALSFVSTAALAEDPAKYPHGTRLNTDGTVDKLGPDMFVLNYGEGNITVEMDDVDRDADAYKLVKGDYVSVTGAIQKIFFEHRVIKARSVTTLRKSFDES